MHWPAPPVGPPTWTHWKSAPQTCSQRRPWSCPLRQRRCRDGRAKTVVLVGGDAAARRFLSLLYSEQWSRTRAFCVLASFSHLCTAAAVAPNAQTKRSDRPTNPLSLSLHVIGGVRPSVARACRIGLVLWGELEVGRRFAKEHLAEYEPPPPRHVSTTAFTFPSPAAGWLLDGLPNPDPVCGV